MARIPLISPDDVPENERAAYDAFVQQRGSRPNTGSYALLLPMPESDFQSRRVAGDPAGLRSREAGDRFDHRVPASSEQAAAAHRAGREFAKRFGDKRFHDVGLDQGIAQVLGANESCIRAGTRNFKDRMGAASVRLYMASPATVAATAITGAIAHPGRFLKQATPS